MLDPRGRSESSKELDFVPLDLAAELLAMTRRQLWKQLQDEGMPLVYRATATGRLPGLERATVLELGERNGRDTGLADEPRESPERLWELVRELEAERDRYRFEVHVQNGRLRDLRSQLEFTEEGYNLARRRLTSAEVDLDRELDEHPERGELEERMNQAERRAEEQLEELRAVRVELDASEAQVKALEHERSLLERELSRAIDRLRGSEVQLASSRARARELEGLLAASRDRSHATEKLLAAERQRAQELAARAERASQLEQELAGALERSCELAEVSRVAETRAERVRELESELETLREFECRREAYCDRLETRLAALQAVAGAGDGAAPDPPAGLADESRADSGAESRADSGAESARPPAD